MVQASIRCSTFSVLKSFFCSQHSIFNTSAVISCTLVTNWSFTHIQTHNMHIRTWGQFVTYPSSPNQPVNPRQESIQNHYWKVLEWMVLNPVQDFPFQVLKCSLCRNMLILLANEIHPFCSIRTGCLQFNPCQGFVPCDSRKEVDSNPASTKNSPFAIRREHDQQKQCCKFAVSPARTTESITCGWKGCIT